jgi:hypothetical protein
MLAIPFGVSLVQALLLCVIDTNIAMEFDSVLKPILNDYFDIPNSIYIIMESVS